MAKIKPLTLGFSNVDELEKMKAEYVFIGREVSVDYQKLELTVPAVSKKRKKKKRHDSKPSRSRYED